MTKTIEQTKECFLDYFKKRDYKTEVSLGLLPSNNSSGVLFMICGGIKYDKIFRAEEASLPVKIARIQNCLRTDNEYRIGNSPRHLTNFRMLEAFSFKDSNFNQTSENMINFLVCSGINPQDIFINVPECECEVKKSVERYASEGVTIRHLPSDKLVWGIKNGSLTGLRMEIGYIPTGWELWNVAYVDPQERKLVDSGMCLERLNASINKYNSVFEIPYLKDMVNLVQKSIPELSKEDACYVADHLVTLNETISQGIFPSSKGPGNKIRYLLKKVLARIRFTGKSLEQLSTLLNMDQSIFGVETQRIEKNYKICEEKFKQYLHQEKQNAFNFEDYVNYIKNKSNSDYFDMPKLFNEEYITIAMQESKKIILPDLSKKELGKKYDLPISLVEKLKS